MPRALVTSAAVGQASIDQPTTRRGVGIEHDAAVDLAFAGGVLGDVGDPQLVGAGPGKAPVGEVTGDVVWLDMPPFRPPGDAGDPSLAHQHLHRAVADADAPALHQLGVDPPGPIGAARVHVCLPDQVGQPSVPDRRPGGARPRHS